jgi:hypothetical protein
MLMGEENAARKKVEKEAKRNSSILEGTKEEAAQEIKRLSLKIDDMNMQAIGKPTRSQRESISVKQVPGSAMSLVKEVKGE